MSVHCLHFHTLNYSQFVPPGESPFTDESRVLPDELFTALESFPNTRVVKNKEKNLKIATWLSPEMAGEN